MRSFRSFASVVSALTALAAAVACGDEVSGGPVGLPDAAAPQPDAAPPVSGDAAAPLDAGGDGGLAADASDAASDAGRRLPDGLLEPVPYVSRADSPLAGVALSRYDHFEDWEDGVLSPPGVVASSTQLGSSFGASFVDSVDGDDGVNDGKCEKPAGTCNSAFAGGTIDFTFDAAVLGALPSHVGIAWTDGSTGCDATFEAFDANDVSLGVRTAAAVGDGSNAGTVAEDRYFAVVHAAGVKKIVVKSSAGGVEVDHLHFGR